jgi:hypothetical protein
MVAAPVVEEITETFVSVDSDGDFEIIEINEIVEDSEDSEDELVEASLETAPIDVVDDKTRPIELPEKSDNELF